MIQFCRASLKRFIEEELIPFLDEQGFDHDLIKKACIHKTTSVSRAPFYEFNLKVPQVPFGEKTFYSAARSHCAYCMREKGWRELINQFNSGSFSS